MFLHIGSQTIIPKDSIEAILNIRTVGVSSTTKDFLKRREKRDIRRVDKKRARSLILTSKREVFFSPIETQTLKRRFERRLFL